jgi:hypothetical protein
MLIFKQEFRSPYPGTGAPSVAPIPPVFVPSGARFAIDQVPNVGLFAVPGANPGSTAVGTADAGLALVATSAGRYAVVS